MDAKEDSLTEESAGTQRGRSRASRTGKRGAPARRLRRRRARSQRGPRSALCGLVVVWLGVGCQGEADKAPEALEIDRVVVITIDTLRADHVGAYGASFARTPVLDGLARDGVRFDVATSPAPVTLPAHTSLFSARDPSEHGVRHNGLFQVQPELPLLAERLSDAGFATGAFVGAFVLDRRFGLARGFDVYDDEMSIDRGTAGTFGFAERTADEVVDRALAWLDGAPDRFFLWAHFYDPHADYRPPAGFALALPGRPYDGEIAFTDSQVGRLLAAIDERWPNGRTLVVATSDHGESLGQHGESTHSYLIYEPTQRIPLLMKGPGLPVGKVVASPVRLIDVAPTVLALLGLPALEGASGVDLRDRIAGSEDAPLVTYMETLAPHFDFGWASLVGVREGDYKLIRGTRTELYDLSTDPGETRNLADERPELVARLEAEIDTRIESGGDPTPTRNIDEEERQRLVALGYLLPEEGSEPAGSWLEGPDPTENVDAIHRVTEAGNLLEQGRWNDALAVLDGLEAGSL
ncbi:MAG: sulfatase, partial [Myxococcota bacterium]|nr:sulfatase [Myxococcota bacterium]